MNTSIKYSTLLLTTVLSVAILALVQPGVASAEDSLSMQRLLQQVKQGRSADAADNQRREQEFLADKAQQEAKIRQAQSQIAALEAKSAELEAQFNANEILVEEKRKQRDERLGSLKELFGHLTGAAGDMRSRFRNSITTTQFPGREKFLSDLIKKMNSDTELPSLDEINQIWFELHREMTESGNVVKYTSKVGTDAGREVTRIGLFNLVSDGDYLGYDHNTQSASVLPRQPSGLKSGAKDLQTSADGLTAVGIDPTGAAGGGFLKAIINTPSMIERWQQGRIVGYIITALGIFALLFAAWRFMALNSISSAMHKQMKEKANSNNPLGRVLSVAMEGRNLDADSLDLKLDEAVLKESPKINSGLSLLKIIAMIAPLLGLLGTVTGMIIVFQAITIYGAGDPKAMAGGISSALVTTVLGLLVAIPILVVHTFLSSKANRLMHILEEQSAGIIAERATK